MPALMRAVLLSVVAASLPRLAHAESAWPGYLPQVSRWNEDYSAQCNGDASLNGLLKLKCLPLGENHRSRVALGGEYRFRIDDYDPPNLGLHNAADFTSVQHRLLVNADFRFGDALRTFVQLGSGHEIGRPIQRPGDEDDADVVQAFFDVRFDLASVRWTLRAGRQELPLGRFAAIRDSTNIRRTFDGVRLDGARGDDGLLFAVVQGTRLRVGHFDDDSNPDDRFGILSVTHALQTLPGFKLDLALLERDNDQAIYLAGPGSERRYSTAARVAGSRGAWDLDAQASYQFGTLRTNGSELDIDAYGAAMEGGLTLRSMVLSPRFAIRVDMASGDRAAGDQRLNTFDLPYPNLSYLSDAAAFAPRNVWNIQPFATAKFSPQLTATLGVQLLWRVSRNDAIYSSANSPLVPPGTSGNFVASQPYVRLGWRPIPLLNVQATLEKIIAGEVVSHAGGGDEMYESLSVTLDI
jgi:hypothetical protein